MAEQPTRKALELERLIFFSDAIVAIAITLLALGLKLDVKPGQPINFYDLIRPWKQYLAFVLSFINIAGFWQTHHIIFTYIKKADRKMMFLNLVWLFFIVLLPYTTSILSTHFADAPAVFFYCANVFFLSVFQKLIWDYGDDNIAEMETDEKLQHTDVMFTLDLLNGLTAIVVSFFSPLTAFILLFFKIPLFIFASFYIAAQRRKGHLKRQR